MLTEDELAALESLLSRARAAAGQVRSETGGTVNVGDLVQLRPGADPHWQTSLLLVCKIRDDGRICGVVLRPHRSGATAAWYTYSPPEVVRIGRAPFPPPESAVAAASFLAQCPRCLGRDSGAPFLEPNIDPYCPKCSAAARAAEPKPKPKPIQREKRKPASLAEVQQAIEELQVGQLLWWAIEEVPKQDGAAPLPEPKPIQRETGEMTALQIGQLLWWVESA